MSQLQETTIPKTAERLEWGHYATRDTNPIMENGVLIPRGKSKVLRRKWRRESWGRQRKINPISHKAHRLLNCFRTLKIQGMPTKEEIYQKIIRPMDCPYCFKSMDFEEISLDHKISRYDGGLNHIDNIVFCCLKCNLMKGVLSDVEFAKLMAIFKKVPGLKAIITKRLKPSYARFYMGNKKNTRGRKRLDQAESINIVHD